MVVGELSCGFPREVYGQQHCDKCTDIQDEKSNFN